MIVNFSPNRCDAFWSREITDRPLLSAWIGSFAIIENYPHSMTAFPQGQVQPHDLDFTLLAQDYERLYDLHARSGSDVPWAAFPIMTLPWVEAILGCPIYHRDGNIWAGHWLENYDQFNEFNLDDRNAWLQCLLEFTSWLVHRFTGRAPVSNSLMRGPLDLLSALRGPERMVLDLFDHPDQIDQTLGKITEIWIQVAQAQQALIPAFEGGYAFGQINLWGRQRGGWYQDDALSLWSPKYYRRHLLSQENKLAGSLPLTGMHLHPGGLFTVPDLIQIPNLDVIEINYDVGGPPLQRFLPSLQLAAAHKCLVLWGDFNLEELELIACSIPVEGLALQLIAATPQEYQKKVSAISEIWQKRA